MVTVWLTTEYCCAHTTYSCYKTGVRYPWMSTDSSWFKRCFTRKTTKWPWKWPHQWNGLLMLTYAHTWVGGLGCHALGTRTPHWHQHSGDAHYLGCNFQHQIRMILQSTTALGTPAHYSWFPARTESIKTMIRNSSMHKRNSAYKALPPGFFVAVKFHRFDIHYCCCWRRY